MMRILALVSMLALAACASGAEAPAVRGSLVPLNPGKWDFNPNALTTPPATEARL